MFLVVKNLNKSYGTNENKISVLKDINFSLEKGALYSIGTFRFWKVNFT